MRRTLTITTALAIAAIALTGCSAGGASQSDSVGLSPVTAPESFESGAIQYSDAGDLQLNRSVITTGWVSITVEEPIAAAADAVRIVESAGGRVDGRSEQAPLDGRKGSATLTLRIPADTLTATLDKLRELGKVEEVSLNSSDVTVQVQDLDARITALEASVDRLLGLMAGATDTQALVSIETALSERQAELESLKAQKRYLDDQVTMSTITLSLISVADAPVDDPDNFFSGLAAGWAALMAFFAGLLVALGVLLPWLVLAGLIATLIVVLVRVLRRRGETPPAG